MRYKPKHKLAHITIQAKDVTGVHDYINSLPTSYIVSAPNYTQFTTALTYYKILLDITDDDMLCLKLKFKTYNVD